ncbi:uncharacterized protein LOC128732655 [Sabethes cyaneus]|uniref:uncharacterized protein LOC128732655 n=1 Tax=Sabethes cyaneus TaxID=53552 RepID=UPI00237D3550|nr:uncharacterized protein LOC128732655 [Sabethes cyaneus]
MAQSRLLLLLLLLVEQSWSEQRKTYHSKISGSNSRFLFSHYPHGQERGHDEHHQSFKKQLESTTMNEIDIESTTLPPTTIIIEEAPIHSELSYDKSLPLRVLDCMTKVSLMDCSKLYVLQNMESRDYNFETSGNLTHDIQQILLPSYTRSDNKLFEDRLLRLNSTEVDRRINRGLALLFNERQVDLTFMPGFRLQISPSQGDVLEFSIKKQFDFAEEGRGRDKDRNKDRDKRGNKKLVKHLVRLGVPVVLLPSMLLASVLPMMLPALKFATFFTSFVNHAALAAAVMYLAKQHAQEQEEKQTVYFNAGYN